jgi:hypothetical protein
MPKRKRKHPSDEISSLAGLVLAGYEPTLEESRKLAASILSLDVVPGPNAGEPPADD